MPVKSSIIKKISVQENGSSVNVAFISQTASLSLKIEHTTHGIIKKYNLSFKIAGVDSNTESLMIRLQKSIEFSVTDAHNFTTIIGSDELRPKVSYTRDTDGFAGGTHGYQVSVVWNYV